jgi:hypothetical protein
MRKTVPLLGKADANLPRLTRYAFVSIEDDLRGKGRVATDLDHHVAPVGIQNMKRKE